jgi:hypothetical protein
MKKINTVRAGRLLKKSFPREYFKPEDKSQNFSGNVKEYKSSA